MIDQGGQIMSAIGQVASGITSSYDTTKTSKSTSKSTNYGNTIGDVQLSDKAAKYYEELKQKYSDMDFVLVSNDEVDNAEQKAAKFANADRTLVLIDADKIEKMAEDEEYRSKYETIIGNANTQLDQMKESLGGLVGDVKTYGIKIDDGGNASFFAVVDKSLASQRERISKNAAEKKEEKAKEAKKAKQEKAEEARNAKSKEAQKTGQYETISSSSAEELSQKITDWIMGNLSDNVRTDAELQVGSQFDFRL